MKRDKIIKFKKPLYMLRCLEAALKMEKKKYRTCPVIGDLSAEHETAQGWSYVVSGHLLLEQSLKAISHVRGRDVQRIHSLNKLFGELCEEDQATLREYYTDYKATMDDNIGRFPFESLDEFLINLDGKEKHAGYLQWRYFLIEEAQRREMPLVSVDYLHEIVYGCTSIVEYVIYGQSKPSNHIYSRRLQQQRREEYKNWFINRVINSDEWNDIDDRLEILWGPDSQGRYDLCLIKKPGTRFFFDKCPDNFALPIVDKREELLNYRYRQTAA